MLGKVVIAADSFKGSLTSAQFARVAADAVRLRVPDCEIVEVGLGDGGEGTLDVLASAMDAEPVSCKVHDPLMRVIDAKYAICKRNNTAIIEMAQASGLPLLADNERNPMLTTTYGTGELIADALRKGCKRIYTGIGGSATNDGGMGALTALGCKFHDKDGNIIDSPGRGCNLGDIKSIDFSNLDKSLLDCEIIVVCDVDNPFCGPNGAACVFAPQKGADDEMCQKLDAGLKNFAQTILMCTGVDVETLPGAGAAGGLGGGLFALLGASMRPGIDMVLEAVDFASKIKDADLIITGEGRLDAQTVMGKTPSGVLKVAQQFGVPVVALGGQVVHCPELDNAGFAAVLSIQSGPCNLTEALSADRASENLAATVSQVVSLISTYSQARCDLSEID